VGRGRTVRLIITLGSGELTEMGARWGWSDIGCGQWGRKRRLGWGDPTGSQAPGGGWHPVGVEVTGWSLDSSAVQGTSAGGEGPCPVVWWGFGGVGSSGVTDWRVGPVERTRKWGWEWPGGVPVKAGMVGGMFLVIW